MGIGQTAFGKGLEDTELSLACQAVSHGDRRRRARAVRRRRARDVLDGGRPRGRHRAQRRPRRHHVLQQVGFGGGAGCGVVGQAAMAVATGQCNVAVAWRARKRSAAASRPWSQVADRLAGHQQWSRPWGVIRPGRRDRDAHPPGDAPVRLHARPPRQRRARVPQARQPQPGRDDGPQGADPRAVPRRALDLRAALPLRQLPRDRRRARDRDHRRPSGRATSPSRRRTSTRSRRASRSSTRS